MKDFGLGIGLGVASCLAVVSTAILSFVLFCPEWQRMTDKEKEIRIINEPPQVWIVPGPEAAHNLRDEKPDLLPPLDPKNP